MHVRNVWAGNFEEELQAFLAETSRDGAIISLTTEFPGAVCQAPWWCSASPEDEYESFRCGVELMKPLQLGVAVGHPFGGQESRCNDVIVKGVWCFNMHFDRTTDLHAEEVVENLAASGIDLARHAREGVDAVSLGNRLAASPLNGSDSQWWVTPAGQQDIGTLVKLLQGSVPLPLDFADFETLLAKRCPRRHEIRSWLQPGSYEGFLWAYGIHHSAATCAARKARATLELFRMVINPSSQEVSPQVGPSITGSVSTAPPGLVTPPSPPPGLVEAESQPTPSTNMWAVSARLATDAVGHSSDGGRRVWGAAARAAVREARAAVEATEPPPALRKKKPEASKCGRQLRRETAKVPTWAMRLCA